MPHRRAPQRVCVGGVCGGGGGQAAEVRLGDSVIGEGLLCRPAQPAAGCAGLRCGRAQVAALGGVALLRRCVSVLSTAAPMHPLIPTPCSPTIQQLLPAHHGAHLLGRRARAAGAEPDAAGADLGLHSQPRGRQVSGSAAAGSCLAAGAAAAWHMQSRAAAPGAALPWQGSKRQAKGLGSTLACPLLHSAPLPASLPLPCFRGAGRGYVVIQQYGDKWSKTKSGKARRPVRLLYRWGARV